MTRTGCCCQVKRPSYETNSTCPPCWSRHGLKCAGPLGGWCFWFGFLHFDGGFVAIRLDFWLVVWNVLIICPYLGNNNPIWVIFFSEGCNHQPDLFHTRCVGFRNLQVNSNIDPPKGKRTCLCSMLERSGSITVSFDKHGCMQMRMGHQLEIDHNRSTNSQQRCSGHI
jgi:hypothetical protein